MLCCASSFVTAAYEKVRLTPLDSRALPAAFLRSRPILRLLRLFSRSSDRHRRSSSISAASRTKPGHRSVKSRFSRAIAIPSAVVRSQPKSSRQRSEPLRDRKRPAKSRTRAYVFSFVSLSLGIVYPCLKPITIMAPVTAPQTSTRPPIPPPNAEAAFRAASLSRPSSPLYVERIACEQLNPSRKQPTASSIFLLMTIRLLSPLNSEDPRPQSGACGGIRDRYLFSGKENRYLSLIP